MKKNSSINVKRVICDRKIPCAPLGSNTTIAYYMPVIVSATDYYPFGMTMQERTYSAGVEAYRYGFNGKENDNEISVDGGNLDFGARIYDSRLGRWMSVDPLSKDYPEMSTYSFSANTPIQAFDPYGRYVIFINGLMLVQALNKDNRKNVLVSFSNLDTKYQANPNYTPYPTYESSGAGPTYLNQIFNYWGPDNSMVPMFNDAFNDPKNYFVNGSDHTWSNANARFMAGLQSGIELIKKIQSGDITLEKDETIKIVAHSQGCAHAAGMAYALDAAFKNGIIKNKVEQIVYLAPQEPMEIMTPQNIPSIQYSRQSDKVSSVGIVSTSLLSGGSCFGPIKGITKFVVMGNMQGGVIFGNRGGHDVGTFIGIFKLIPGQTPTSPPNYDIKAPPFNLMDFLKNSPTPTLNSLNKGK